MGTNLKCRLGEADIVSCISEFRQRPHDPSCDTQNSRCYRRFDKLKECWSITAGEAASTNSISIPRADPAQYSCFQLLTESSNLHPLHQSSSTANSTNITFNFFSSHFGRDPRSVTIPAYEEALRSFSHPTYFHDLSAAFASRAPDNFPSTLHIEGYKMTGIFDVDRGGGWID